MGRTQTKQRPTSPEFSNVKETETLRIAIIFANDALDVYMGC